MKMLEPLLLVNDALITKTHESLICIEYTSDSRKTEYTLFDENGDIKFMGDEEVLHALNNGAVIIKEDIPSEQYEKFDIF